MSHKYAAIISTFFLCSTWSVSPSAGPVDSSLSSVPSVRVRASSVAERLISSDRDGGRADPNVRIEDARITLRRSDSANSALELRISQQRNPRSPYYRKWLSSEEIGVGYGPSTEAVKRTEGWLRSKGFTVTRIGPSLRSIEFSGPVASFESAFGANIL